MTEPDAPTEMLQPIEDVGGAAQPLLQVNGLTKHFPVRGDLFSARKTVRAVDDVSFSIAKGETVGIVGESGCGKSTTARLLMHLMKRDSGDIIYDGRMVGRALSLRELRRGMQMVFQDSYASLNPRLTIEQSIAFGPKVHGMADAPARALARELLGKVGLRPENFANRYPHEISGGQRQRVNIARALALSPRLQYRAASAVRGRRSLGARVSARPSAAIAPGSSPAWWRRMPRSCHALASPGAAVITASSWTWAASVSPHDARVSANAWRANAMLSGSWAAATARV